MKKTFLCFTLLICAAWVSLGPAAAGGWSASPNSLVQASQSASLASTARASNTTQGAEANVPHQSWLPFVVSDVTVGLAETTPLTPTRTSEPAATCSSTPTSTPTGTPSPTATAIPTSTPTPTLAALVIGHVTDVHIGAKYIYVQRFPAVLEQISQQAEVMVDTGDCTENGTAEEAIEYAALVTDNVTIPWRATPGNHDTQWIFERFIGPLEWSWDIAGYRLIGINTESINYAALDAALTHEKPCIIFGHFPLEWCSWQDQSELRQRFRDYQVPLYVTGHLHQNRIERDPLSGTLVVTTERGGSGHYALVRLQGRTVESVDFRSIF